MKRDPADIAFSKLVRLRAHYRCECCGKQYGPSNTGLHCSHFYGRRSRATRWHALNAAAHCYGCHQRLGSNPVVFAEWIDGHIGSEANADLRLLHSLPVKLSKKDLADIAADLRAQLRDAQPGQQFETPATILLAIDEAKRLSGRIQAAGAQ